MLNRVHLRVKPKPNVPKPKKPKKKEPDSSKTTAIGTLRGELSTETETNSTIQTSSNSLAGVDLGLPEPAMHMPKSPRVVTERTDMQRKKESGNAQAKHIQSSQDESASSADEAKKSKLAPGIARFGRSKHKPVIPKKSTPKIISIHGPSQPLDMHTTSLPKSASVSAPFTSETKSSKSASSSLQIERPELPASPSKHLVPAAPHCVPPPLDPSSSEDEGVIDPYDPNNPQGAKSERERGRHRKNQRIVKTFNGGKPRAMIDYIFYNPKANPMQHTQSDRILPPETREDEQEDDPDEVPGSLNVPAPQIIISAEGKLVVDDKTLTTETSVAKEGRVALGKTPIIVTNGFGGRGCKKSPRTLWTNEETVFFYKCLNNVGTDFEIISRYFPNRERRQIKLKFKLEEKRHPTLVDRALRVNANYDTTELDVEFQKIADQANKEREDKKHRRTKGTSVRTAAKPRAQKKKKGPRNRTDYYLVEGEESGSSAAEGGSSSSEDEGDEAVVQEMEAQLHERKPGREGLHRVKHEPKQAVHSAAAAATTVPVLRGPSLLPSLATTSGLQDVESLPTTEHVAYLDIAESREDAARTLNPEELLVSDVACIINPESQATAPTPAHTASSSPQHVETILGPESALLITSPLKQMLSAKKLFERVPESKKPIEVTLHPDVGPDIVSSLSEPTHLNTERRNETKTTAISNKITPNTDVSDTQSGMKALVTARITKIMQTRLLPVPVQLNKKDPVNPPLSTAVTSEAGASAIILPSPGSDLLPLGQSVISIVNSHSAEPAVLTEAATSQSAVSEPKSAENSILEPNKETLPAAVPCNSEAPKPDRISRRKAPLIIKIPFEEEDCIIISDSPNIQESPPPNPPKKMRGRKKKILPEASPQRSVTPEQSLSDEEDSEEICSDDAMSEQASESDDVTERDSSDSEQMEMEFLARDPLPTRSGRLPKSRKSEQLAVTDMPPKKQRKVVKTSKQGCSKSPGRRLGGWQGKLSPPSSPKPPSSPELSDSSENTHHGSMFVVQSNDENNELYQVFMIPPGSGGTTLEHNPDGSLQRLSVGSSSVSVGASASSPNFTPTLLPPGPTIEHLTSSHHITAETLHLLAQNGIVDPQDLAQVQADGQADNKIGLFADLPAK